ncbi:hypothetical protein KUTeg_019565 [Tegillarca granosa]|uniref:Kinesin motor domain-containing protein n=1 Tax=Tegillarca granosa TaxID=220873 RepID=A0ABQ9ECV8_TEGGR|nr:hypothetical protein KUTeg_019565 [Tegillarca granosa]
MPEEKVIPVRVALRCRPLIPKEVNEGCQQCLTFTPNEPQVILGKDKAFTYDYVFSPQNMQPEVYSTAVHPLVKHILRGYNATVLAYGQTGSGKTYSMGGCYEASLNEDQEEMGIIPRVLKELFQGITDKTESIFVVKVSYLEIHNEDINDLLCSPSKREPLSIREDVNGGIKLPGLSEVVVSSYEDTMSCLQSGSQGRTTGSTAMNSTSSRSHAIFTIHIEQKKKEDMDEYCHCKFHLVDLAGSERAKRTQAEGERFKEGININRGLLALGNVISALGDEAQKRSHIPYRDSKLTRLLQDSLGGNSYTLMIACVSPADSNMEETLNTLRYADRARKIKNKPIVNMDPQAAEIMRLKQLVQQLQLQMINGGLNPALTTTTSNASSGTSICMESSTDELKSLIERNKQLEDENDKLSLELRKAVDQSTNMCEKAIRLEVKCDKLKQRFFELKQDTGVDLEVLSSSLDVENNPHLKEQLDKLRLMSEKIKEESAEDKDVLEQPEEEEEDDEENYGESAPGTPDTRAMSKEYALRQAKLGQELLQLNKLLEKKEMLANQMTQNDDKMESMRQQYEVEYLLVVPMSVLHFISTEKNLLFTHEQISLSNPRQTIHSHVAKKDMENEINSLQREKDNLQHALEDARSNANANKYE